MRIIELRANNFARLVAVEIRPDGTLVPIVGKNSAGKTSVLTAIWTALMGRAVAPADPIHDGAERAVIRLDIGDAVITRTFTRGKLGELTTDLKVVAADGTKVRAKPQEWIDRTLAATCFNPLEFVRQPAKVQFDTLRKFVPGVDFDDITKRRQQAFEARTASNHRLNDAKVQAETIVLPPGPEPVAVDTADLVMRLGDATEANSARSATVAEIARLRNEAGRLLDEAEQLRARANTMEKQADQKTLNATTLESQLPAVVDTAAISAQLASAQTVQQTRAKFEERRRALADVERHKVTSDGLTQAIADLDKQKADAIAAAKLPVPGLTFGDDNVVLLNGVPLSQAGTAEKIRVGVAVGMSLNPTLRVILIDEASELDAESLAMVEAMAKEQGFQVWCAKIDDTGTAPGFQIVDGRVAGQTSTGGTE
jgi:hypothetical protein